VFVYLLKNTRISPNQVTLASLVVMAGAGAIFIFLPGHLWLIVAALVVELSFILDCADGMLSRARGTSSHLGHLLDFLVDEIKAMMLYGCVTVRLWRDTADERYLLVGIAGGFVIATAIAFTSFMRRPEYSGERPTEDGQPAKIARRTGLIGMGVTTLEHIARLIVHYPVYIWACAAFNRIDIYFWIYGSVNLLYLGRCFLSVTLRLGGFAPKPTSAIPSSDE
jgi:phosphatidylglycerophosphate synthase